MANKVRRLILPIIGIGLGCALGSAAWFARPVLSVLTGHKAKVLCSGVFVSRRAPAAVLDDLQVDDLTVLRYVDASVDTVARTVTTRALGMQRRAVYREGLGCALALDSRDGGGKVAAALNVIEGAERVSRVPGGRCPQGVDRRPVGSFDTINGSPGLIVSGADGLVQASALEIEGDSVKAIYVVRNPDKLRHLDSR